MTKDIQKVLITELVQAGHEAVCENFGHSFEMDVASLSKSGMLHEYEVKISRSDFLADKNKNKRTGTTKFQMYGNAVGRESKCPNYFYYVCPEGLISKTEIPHYAGLYYYKDGCELLLVKHAIKLHQVPADKLKIISKMLRMTVQRKYLGCTMLTHNNREAKRKNEEREKYRQSQTNLLIDFAQKIRDKKLIP